MTELKLTPKQELFAQTYIKTSNASEAYRKAYNVKKKSDNSLWVQASNLLSHPKVSIRIEQLQAQLAEKHDITKDKIINELCNIAFLNVDSFYNSDGTLKQLDELDIKAKSALQSYRVKSINIGDGEKVDVPVHTSYDKIKAIDTINKLLGYYAAEKVEHSGKIDVNTIASRLIGR